jgi:two-component system response regulator DevR
METSLTVTPCFQASRSGGTIVDSTIVRDRYRRRPLIISAGMLKEIRVVLACRKQSLRDGLSDMLETELGVRVVGTHSSGGETLSSVEALDPDILLLDVGLADMTGLDVIEQLNDRTKARTIVLTEDTEPEVLTRAALLGASGAIEKKAELPLLLKCMRSVMTGDFWFDRKLTPALLDCLDSFEDRRTSTGRCSERLTEREREVFEAVAHGMSNREIALKLHLSEHTVKQHLKRIFEKLGVSSRVELVLLVAKSRLGPATLPKRKITRT